MNTRKALGKGLGALLPNKGKITLRVSEIPVKEIKANRYQPRKFFNDESIKELSASIKEKGVIQPVLVHKVERGYELIAGERRYRATRLLGLETIPAIVKNIQRSEALEIAIVENVQREDLNPIEEARAYKLLMDDFNLTQEGVAKKVGRERSTVANILRLLKLPPLIRKDIESGRLTMGHARALLACETETAMLEMRKQILDYGLNVREVEQRSKKKKSASKRTSEIPPYLRDISEQIQKRLATKVTIKPKRKKGGIISIEYYSDEDLDRIIETIS